jgi:hypothetical protein
MANDSPIDKLNEARNGTLEVPGYGKAGRELSEGSALGDISKAFGRDILGEAEALANGDASASTPGPSLQDKLGHAIERAGGAVSEGGSNSGLGGVLIGMVFGLLGSAASRATGGRINPGLVTVGANVVGAVVEASRSDKTQDKDKPQTETGGPACDPLTQCCPGTKGMGDDQEGQTTKGDPTLNSLELARRVKGGDGRAADVLAARNGTAAAIAPAWARNSDARDGQGNAIHDGEALLKGVARLDAVRESEDRSQAGGTLPPIEFGQSIADREGNLILNPLPV